MILLIAIIITTIVLIATYIYKCKCGCWRGCGCMGCCCTAESFLPINSTRVVTLHYTKWCPGCAVMKPVWERVKHSAQDSGIKFMEVDEDIEPTPGIDGYPTIRMITEQGRMTQYTGGPDYARLRNWVASPIPYVS